MKVAVAGAGSIVRELLSVKDEIKSVSFECLFARRAEVRAEISEKYRIRSLGSYEELLASDTDAVYIALPNDLHFEYAKRALESGKSVILEKPFTASVDECDTLIGLASEKGLFLFEAISNIHTDNIKIMKTALKDENIKSVNISFMQRSRRYDDFKKGIIHPVFDKNKYGGALYDLGVYALHALIYLFGAPKKAEYMASMERGVDVSGRVRLSYDGFDAICNISKCEEGENGIFIECEGKTVSSRSKPNELSLVEISSRKDERCFQGYTGARRLVYEWERFADIFDSRDSVSASCLLRLSRTVMSVVSQISAISM